MLLSVILNVLLSLQFPYETKRNLNWAIKCCTATALNLNDCSYLERVYPDANADDFRSSDNVCIICREEMVAGNTCKKLPCGHIFHKSCLRTWFQRQQSCPTCRLDIIQRANLAAPPGGGNLAGGGFGVGGAGARLAAGNAPAAGGVPAPQVPAGQPATSSSPGVVPTAGNGANASFSNSPFSHAQFQQQLAGMFTLS